jgi:hypothetical protein
MHFCSPVHQRVCVPKIYCVCSSEGGRIFFSFIGVSLAEILCNWKKSPAFKYLYFLFLLGYYDCFAWGPCLFV